MVKGTLLKRLNIFRLQLWVLLLWFTTIQFSVTNSILPQKLEKFNHPAENITFNFTTEVPLVTVCNVLKLADGSPIRKVCKEVNSSLDGAQSTKATIKPLTAATAAVVIVVKKVGEVQDMTNSSYEGGQDVDELGKGSQLDKPDSRESAKVEAEKRAETEKNLDAVGGREKKTMGITTVAAVAAGACLLLVVSGYTGLLIWKRISLNRYGNREELINEDDLGDFNESDLHYFEGATIEIET